MKIRVEDLLFLPRHAMRWHMTPWPGHGTVILLPDGVSRGAITSVVDERWKSWGSQTFEVNMLITGPAVTDNARALMDLFRHEMGSGGWRTYLTGATQASLRGDAEFEVLQAVPHSCASLPGEPCGVRNGGRSNGPGGVCTADRDAQPVDLLAVAA